MKKFVEHYERYQQNESNLLKVRETFFQKGIVKRELVSDELSFSWLRTKFKNIEPSFLPLFDEQNARKILGNGTQKVLDGISNLWMGCFSKNGKLLCYYLPTANEMEWRKIKFNNFDIGFNGISQAIELGRDSIVIGQEHYLDIFKNYISIGLVDGDYVYGVILPLLQAKTKHLELIDPVVLRNLFRNEMMDIFIERPEVYFFDRDVYVFDQCFKKYQQIVSQFGVVQFDIIGKLPAQVLVGFLGKDKKTKKKIEYICSSMCDSYEKLELGLKSEEKLLVIESIGAFERQFQEKIWRYVSSKLINSNRIETNEINSLKIIFLKNSEKNCSWDLPFVLSELQMFLMKLTIKVPRLSEVGTQFKSYLSKEIQRRGIRLDKPFVAVDQEVLNALTAYEWPGEYNELQQVIRSLLEVEEVVGKISLEAVPGYIAESEVTTNLGMSLREKEAFWIKQCLQTYDWNLKKTAEILEITRSTLYKKIEIYGINREK